MVFLDFLKPEDKLFKKGFFFFLMQGLLFMDSQFETAQF